MGFRSGFSFCNRFNFGLDIGLGIGLGIDYGSACLVYKRFLGFMIFNDGLGFGLSMEFNALYCSFVGISYLSIMEWKWSLSVSDIVRQPRTPGVFFPLFLE